MDGKKKDGHGSWTGWSRKPDGMVTVSGQKRKIYCTNIQNRIKIFLTNDEEIKFEKFELKNLYFINE